ncbi:putative leader peptide [Streptomyces griseoloalbus]|uniref:putative leader peptide n=1 Tax=Streptomyces griseoloalbus TaxID=67303 RepID=UPI0028A5DEDB|nr:putative leader peptide [Streptomyces albaduncus]
MPGRFALYGRFWPHASQSKALRISKFRCYGLLVKSAAVFPTPRSVPLVARLHVDLCRVTSANCRH